MIQELQHQFDLEKLRQYFASVKSLGSDTQVCLTHRPGQEPYKDGCGSAYIDNDLNQKIFDEKDFTELVGQHENPIYSIIEQVKAIALENYGLSIGRIRFMTQNPKTCLSYHRDIEEFRFHIPLHTNIRCFFVVNDRVFRMPKEGHLYTLKTDQYHTPVNANISFARTHLVFTTYK